MSSSKKVCRLCNIKFNYNGSWPDSNYCKLCDLALFQVKDAMDLYMSGEPPEWLRRAMLHLGWLFESYPRTAAYLNLATEIMFSFVIAGETSFEESELKELNFTKTSPNTVKAVLQDAFLIKVEDGRMYPGKLIEEIARIRLSRYTLKSIEFKEKVREVRGVLAVALTLGLVENPSRFRPQRPLSVFRILGKNILNSGLQDTEAISQTLSELSFDTACFKLSARQKRRLLWHISGFSTGHPYIIENIEDEHLVFDTDMMVYMDRVRERYRERERARERES